MAGVRSFTSQDIPGVADLHRRLFLPGARRDSMLDRAYAAYFSEVFLNNPWRHSGLTSLVFEDGSGAVGGFLGVLARPMTVLGRPLLAALTSQFIVDPAYRSKLVAVRILQRLLSGPQEITFADESGDESRRLWEGLGGSTSVLQSLYWVRLIRPCRFLASYLLQRAGAPWRVADVALRPVCGAADAAVRALGYPPPLPLPRLHEEPLSAAVLLAATHAFAKGKAIQAVHDERSLEWLLDRAGRGPRASRGVVLRDDRNQIAGWYLYQVRRDQMGEVLLLGAARRCRGRVLDHLFHDAARNGIAAMSGRLESDYLPELRDRRCLLHHRGWWMLAHSTREDSLEAILHGSSSLTRLDGEPALRFEPESTTLLDTDSRVRSAAAAWTARDV